MAKRISLDEFELLVADSSQGDQLASAAIQGISGEVVQTVSGRAAVSRVEIEGVGPSILRQYRRGGMLRHVIREHFFHPPWQSIEESRPFVEFRVLETLEREGIQAPVPLAAVLKRRGLWYSAYLLTKEIRGCVNLLDVLTEDRDLESISSQVAQAAAKVLGCGIEHRDLHLGNVLLNESGQVILIDYDKASLVRTGKERDASRRNLRERWQRSLQKHLGVERTQPLMVAFDRGLGRE